MENIIIAALPVLGSVIVALITSASNKSTIKSELSGIKNAAKASLCDDLMVRGKKIKKEGSVSEEEYKRFVEDYHTYKSIGGNGYIDDLKESVEKIYASQEIK